MSIIKKLLGLKTSADFNDAIHNLQAEIAAEDAKIVDLDTKIKAAAFDVGEEEMNRLKAQQRAIEEHISTLTDLAEEAQSRRDAALRNEAAASLEKRMKAAVKDRRLLIKEYGKLHEAAKLLSASIVRCEELYLSINKANEAARFADRHDLKVAQPIGLIPRANNAPPSDPLSGFRLPDGYRANRDDLLLLPKLAALDL